MHVREVHHTPLVKHQPRSEKRRRPAVEGLVHRQVLVQDENAPGGRTTMQLQVILVGIPPYIQDRSEETDWARLRLHFDVIQSHLLPLSRDFAVAIDE